MYDALLSGVAGATAEEQALLRTVHAQVAGWRLRKRFDTAAAADAYRKATSFETLVRVTAPRRIPLCLCDSKAAVSHKACVCTAAVMLCCAVLTP